MTQLRHKGRTGSYTWNQKSRCWSGSLTDDLITFEGKTVDEVEIAFIATVDSYLQKNV